MVKRKQLNAKHTRIETRYFPFYGESRGGYRVVLGIGGNVGDVVRRFEHLFLFFRRSSFIHIVQSAPILKNPPFGYTKQADFYNTVLEIETPLMPYVLLRYLLRVEKRFGRKRSFQDAPRTLDIDILFYENRTINTERLTLPHPGWTQRDSVLIPLAYMKG
jgi:2-amino-4-hydroxy-6-hydroxymethyldihydropteridine diphosphokinase